MKATMKKVVALMLVMVMLCVPVVAYAAPGDSEAEAITVTETGSVTVPAGATVYYAYNGLAGVQYNLTVTGTTGFEVSTPHPWTGMLVPTPDTDGAVAVPVTAGAMWSMTPGVASFAITNHTDAEQTYTIAIVLPKGTTDNPDDLVLGTVESVSADGSAYWYTWTAAEDGTVTLDFTNAGENGWELTVLVDEEYITSHSSGEAAEDPSVVVTEVPVTAGSVLKIGVNNYDWIPGLLVTFVASFEAGEIVPVEDVQINLTYANGYDWSATQVYVFASTEGQTVADIHGSADFPYFYHALLQYNEETEKFEVVNCDTAFAGEYVNWPINENQISIMAHDSCTDADSLDALKNLAVGDSFYLVGDYNAILSGTGALEGTYLTTEEVDHWTPSGGDIGGGDEVNYEEMNIALELGTHTYATSMMYTYSIYTFDPTEIGKYTISSTDSLVGIVSANGMWITVDPSAESVAENSFVWECTSVGQSIWVAAMPDTNVATITVEREDINVSEIPKVDYENVETPEEFTYSGNVEDLQYVDTEDDVVDTAVLGEDGLYHLNSEDGPILYVDLDDEIMNLIDAMGYGQLKDVVTEDGEVVSIIDYNTAFGEYAACADENGLYPLTEDLMVIYQSVGAYQGWYGENGWVGGLEEDAWMFACYYAEGETGKPDAGDASNALVFAILAFVAVAGTAVVVKTRR